MKTQHEKILAMCEEGGWVCQTQFWAAYIRSPHKRRSEIADKYGYEWRERGCIHGVRGSKDYLLVRTPITKQLQIL